MRRSELNKFRKTTTDKKREYCLFKLIQKIVVEIYKLVKIKDLQNFGI